MTTDRVSDYERIEANAFCYANDLPGIGASMTKEQRAVVWAYIKKVRELGEHVAHAGSA